MRLYFGNTVTTITTVMILALLGFMGYSIINRANVQYAIKFYEAMGFQTYRSYMEVKI